MVALHLSLQLERGVAGGGKGVADDVAEETVRVRPAQQSRGPTALRVARPRHDPAQPVLPRRQQGIAGRALEDDVGRGARRRGHVAGQGR